MYYERYSDFYVSGASPGIGTVDSSVEWVVYWQMRLFSQVKRERGGMEDLVDYGPLFTDFYQLTMAQLYFQQGLHRKKVQFDYFFRTYPDYGGHQAGYCISAGMQGFVSWLESLEFKEYGITCLRNQRSISGKPLFTEDFLQWLRSLKLSSSITLLAIPEGRVVHPYEPLVTVQGELACAQLIESSLLNHLNFQALIATKASRIKEAGAGRPLIEFGMRRAHGWGADAASRAALIGGADFTSNTEISCDLQLPPRGTHAHSMVQVFMALGEGEEGAFRAYAQTYPDECLLLVDTVNTLESGVPNAIKVFQELRKKGHRPVGIRLDSGDLAYLAIKAAKMLDRAGFSDTTIVLSNNINEMVLMQVLRQIRDEAPIHGMDPQKIISRLTYGVGTHLVTSQGHGALDGVYKLTAVHGDRGWIPALKISETSEKTTNPGFKQVWRLYDRSGMANADLIALGDENPAEAEQLLLHHPTIPEVSRMIKKEQISSIEPLLIEVIKGGEVVFRSKPIRALRENRDHDLKRLDPGVKRLINPHRYHVALSDKLFHMKQELIRKHTEGFV